MTTWQEPLASLEDRLAAAERHLLAGGALGLEALALLSAARHVAASAGRRQDRDRTRAQAREQRNEAIRRAAALVPGCRWKKATALSSAAQLYRSTSWRRDRESVQMPGHLVGTVQGHLWVAMKLSEDGRIPTGSRQLWTIIGG
jgi:hypothetical protein